MFQLRKLLPRRLKSLTYYMTHPVSYPLNLAITSSFSGMGKTPNDMAIWKQLEFNSRKSGWKIDHSICISLIEWIWVFFISLRAIFIIFFVNFVWIFFSFFYWSFGSLSIFKNSSQILALCDIHCEYFLPLCPLPFDFVSKWVLSYTFFSQIYQSFIVPRFWIRVTKFSLHQGFKGEEFILLVLAWFHSLHLDP